MKNYKCENNSNIIIIYIYRERQLIIILYKINLIVDNYLHIKNKNILLGKYIFYLFFILEISNRNFYTIIINIIIYINIINYWSIMLWEIVINTIKYQV